MQVIFPRRAASGARFPGSDTRSELTYSTSFYYDLCIQHADSNMKKERSSALGVIVEALRETLGEFGEARRARFFSPPGRALSPRLGPAACSRALSSGSS